MTCLVHISEDTLFKEWLLPTNVSCILRVYTRKKNYNTKQKGQIKTILPGGIGKVYKGEHLSDIKD